MKYSSLPDPLDRLLSRPEFAPLVRDTEFLPNPALQLDFVVSAGGQVIAGKPWLRQAPAATSLRQALELSFLLRLWPDQPALAGLAAARCAALFARMEQLCTGLEDDVLADADVPPDEATAARWWDELRAHQLDAPIKLPEGTCADLARLWPVLGPTEWLLTTGGDERLRIDAQTGLNQYGCSPRPRPYAITYASSTASSISQRGYEAAEAERRALVSAPHRIEARYVALAEAFRAEFALPPETGVIFAASGTDSELVALAACAQHPAGLPVTSILLAAEETGSGVPLAAAGRHFAGRTALGGAASKADGIVGFAADTHVVGLSARDVDGQVRPPSAVALECLQTVTQAVGDSRRCLVHLPDLSKTGLLPVAPDALESMLRVFPDAADVVVDACQTRLDAARLSSYLRRGWMVQITGSKFFTGPPFSGAILLPPALAARLKRGVPAGLSTYSARAEWVSAGIPLPDGLAAGGNPGLLLRWRAALAEIRAFHSVPQPERLAILETFLAAARTALASVPGLTVLDAPAPARSTGGAHWDCLTTILTFTLRPAGQDVPCNMPQARQIHRWLNMNLRPILSSLAPEDVDVAGRCCHIGQPVAIGAWGALRISAGARLVSGEPLHSDLDVNNRLSQEVSDVKLVAAKLALILKHAAQLSTAPV